jgi:hypothetical protein
VCWQAGQYHEDVRRWVGRPRAGVRDKSGQSGSVACVQTQIPGQQLVSTRIEGSGIVVEREVELEAIWNVRCIALDPRTYTLYAYAQMYLGYWASTCDKR